MKRPIWLQLVALTALTAGMYLALTLAGLPAVALLAALVSAAALTVIGVVRMALPPPVMTGAQVVMGVTIGTMVTPKAAREVVAYSYAVAGQVVPRGRAGATRLVSAGRSVPAEQRGHAVGGERLRRRHDDLRIGRGRGADQHQIGA